MNSLKVSTTSLFATLIISTLSGCATKQTYWEKPGANNNDFNLDRAQCNVQGLTVPGVTLMGLAMIQNQCLQGKGWYLVER
jgi:hypothetical protein